MSYYKIGSLYLEAPRLPQSYRPFEIDSFPSEKISDLIHISFHYEEPGIRYARLVTSLPQMNIWEVYNSEYNRIEWVYKDLKDRGLLLVSNDYRNGRFFSSNLPRQEELAVLAPLLQTQIECSLIQSGIQVLHSACVETNEGAIAFSAPSGTGKSTRAQQFVDHLGASWISGDRPAIDPTRKRVYGVPWDGKEQLFVNKTVPLRALVEVRRSRHTILQPLTRRQAISFLANQLLIPLWDTSLAAKALHGLEEMTHNLPILRLYSDCTPEAAGETDAALHEILKLQSCFPAELSADNQNNQQQEREKEMKLKDGFEITELSGDYMLIPTGDNIASFGGSVVLNGVSAFLLNNMKAPITRDELLALLLAEYNVEKERAEKDLDNILETFQKLEIVE